VVNPVVQIGQNWKGIEPPWVVGDIGRKKEKINSDGRIFVI
jgi:hypothetical protein